MKTVEVFPSVPYHRYIIYENLTIFWIAIICLLVLIRMKLREIERVQKMVLDREKKADKVCHHVQTEIESMMDHHNKHYDKECM